MLSKIKREIVDPVIEEVVRDTAACILETDPHALTVQRMETYPGGPAGWYAWFTEYPEDGGIDVTPLDVLTMGRPRLAARRVGGVVRQLGAAGRVGFWTAVLTLVDARADTARHTPDDDEDCPGCADLLPYAERVQRARDDLHAAVRS